MLIRPLMLMPLLVLSAAALAAAADPPASPAPPPAGLVIAPVAGTPTSGAVATQQTTPRERDRTDTRFLWSGDHPSLRSGRWLRLDFKGRIQVDQNNPGDEPVDYEDTWELHRARLGIDGELFRVFQFSIEREFSETEVDVSEVDETRTVNTPWKDIWGELNLNPAFQIRGGRFKIPFGLDQLTSVSVNDFIYRSLGGSGLSPARDTGAVVHGRFFDRGLTYEFGWFEHDGDNSRNKKVLGGDDTWAGRVTARPFTRVKAGNLDRVEFGVSGTTTKISDQSPLPNGLRGRTVLTRYEFFEPVFVNGTRTRFGLDVDWEKGPVGARAEYIALNDDRIDQGLRGDTLKPARAKSWYVSGTWVVFGGNKDRPVAPDWPLFQGGAGAVELAARYESLRFDSEPTGEPAFQNSRAEVILPNSDKVTSLGVNWFFNRWTKVQFNAIREEIEDPGRTPLADGGTSWWSTMLRFQFAM